MTIVEPIPDLQWGRGAWQDYISNWRTRDTSWMQERLILRYQTSAARTSDWGATPKAGQVTYNDETKTLEMWRAGSPGAWVRSLMFQFLTSNKDDAAGVNLSHTGASGKGVQLTPTSMLVDAPTTNWLNGVAILDATGLALKVGAITAKLSTDVDGLTVDPLVKTGSLLAASAAITGQVSAGSLAAATATLTTSLTMTGATMNGGVLNPTRANINGVQIGWDPGLTVPAAAANLVTANQGLVSNQGYFTGDGGSAIMRQRTPASGAVGAAFIQVSATDINVGPNPSTASVYMYPQLRIMGGKGVPWHNPAGTHVAWISPVIYSGSDPGAGNYPDGTLWIS